MSRAGEIKTIATEVDGLVDEMNEMIAALRALASETKSEEKP